MQAIVVKVMVFQGVLSFSHALALLRRSCPSGIGNQTLSNGCRDVWRESSRLLSSIDPSLPANHRQRIRTDLLDLAILWSDLHIHVAMPDQVDHARREALQVLTEAESEFGGSIVLSRERQKLTAALGRNDLARQAAKEIATLTPRTAWEHHAIGRSLLGSGQYDRAAKQLRQAVDHDPGGVLA